MLRFVCKCNLFGFFSILLVYLHFIYSKCFVVVGLINLGVWDWLKSDLSRRISLSHIVEFNEKLSRPLDLHLLLLFSPSSTIERGRWSVIWGIWYSYIFVFEMSISNSKLIKANFSQWKCNTSKMVWFFFSLVYFIIKIDWKFCMWIY